MASAQKLIIITAPSGSGKSTIVNFLMKEIPSLAFSVSACTRKPREGEVHGVNYYFLSVEEFQQHIENNDFAEYEMVYEGKYYGTLRSELSRMWNEDKVPVVDIDVQGALRLKREYNQHALSLFIKAPSIAELEKRLRHRGTETEHSLKERLDKASEELSYANQFDHIVVNDELDKACQQAKGLILRFISNK